MSTKLHLSCDGEGRPLPLVVTAGQRHDSTQLSALLDAIRVARVGAGRPRKRPEHLIADKGYSYASCRALLSRRGIRHTIPERRDQRERREGRSGRKPGFDKAVYAKRNVVERCVEPAKAVAGDSDALREAGGQLPGGGGHRLVDDLVEHVNHQTRPRTAAGKIATISTSIIRTCRP